MLSVEGSRGVMRIRGVDIELYFDLHALEFFVDRVLRMLPALRKRTPRPPPTTLRELVAIRDQATRLGSVDGGDEDDDRTRSAHENAG